MDDTKTCRDILKEEEAMRERLREQLESVEKNKK